MKTYRVYIYERLVHSIEIEAETVEGVLEKAYGLLENGTAEQLNKHNYSNESQFTDDEVVQIKENNE